MEIIILCVAYPHYEENNMPDCCERFVSCFGLLIYICIGIEELTRRRRIDSKVFMLVPLK